MHERLTDEQLAARCADASKSAPARSRWRHLKTGDVYEVRGVALTSCGLDPVVIYSCTNGMRPAFTRPASEFLDGRFERLTQKGQD